ncbi:MAG: ParB N-terminal domain-containing protein [Veillonellaceae bacterium]|nr:ParB N-terminal domain-containing protein [Veillonellaceae bacterium]
MTQKAKAQATEGAGMQIEQVPISSLTPHARNFRHHPSAQLEHLQQSLREYGWARNVVVSRDNVILAGHGIVEAARKEGHTTVPVYRLNLKGDDPKAEKFLVLENTVSRLAEDDDTQLAALLADVQRTEGLEGTGYTDGDLDALIAEMAAEGADVTPKDAGVSAQAWMVVVDCADEQQQVQLLERFESEGLQCRALIG